jgi:hypothetical protein
MEKVRTGVDRYLDKLSAEIKSDKMRSLFLVDTKAAGYDYDSDADCIAAVDSINLATAKLVGYDSYADYQMVRDYLVEQEKKETK